MSMVGVGWCLQWQPVGFSGAKLIAKVVTAGSDLRPGLSSAREALVEAPPGADLD